MLSIVLNNKYMCNKISLSLLSLLMLVAIKLYLLNEAPKQVGKSIDPCVTEGRTSVTFIMGDDESQKNNFYKNATYFYHMDITQKTDFVVHSCKTLMDVSEYLSNNSNGKKFGTINMVCHGNPWQGLSILIAKHLPRANVSNLENALKNKWIKPLCSDGIDHNTIINIVSCGVGKNNDFKSVINKFFTCPDNPYPPLINIETHFVNFSDKHEKRLSDFYFVLSKYEFDDPQIIANKLQNKYQQILIDWQTAYNHDNKLSGDRPYKHQFKMLVEWKIGFEHQNEIPNLSKEPDIVTWLKTQNDAMTELEQMKLKLEDFMWHSFVVTDQQNTLKIKGYANVEGVLVDVPPNEITEL